VGIEELKGKTLTKVWRVGDDVLEFQTDCGERYRLYHSQDCCENVNLAEVIGDIDDLVGAPILEAEERTSREDKPSDYAESWTWTFYKLGTIKGHVTLRWLGESNGYYSESVDFCKLSTS